MWQKINNISFLIIFVLSLGVNLFAIPNLVSDIESLRARLELSGRQLTDLNTERSKSVVKLNEIQNILNR